MASFHVCVCMYKWAHFHGKIALLSDETSREILRPGDTYISTLKCNVILLMNIHLFLQTFF